MFVVVFGFLGSIQVFACMNKRAIEQMRADRHATPHEAPAPEVRRVGVEHLPPIARQSHDDAGKQGSTRWLMLTGSAVGLGGLVLFASGFAVFSLRRPEEDEDDSFAQAESHTDMPPQ